MKVLNLIIKQAYFDQILAGEKTVETREIRPKTAGRYIFYENNDTGVRYEPKDIDTAHDCANGYSFAPIEYDAIRFCVGYATNRPECLVECKGAQIVSVLNEADGPIIYEVDGVQYFQAEIEYTLGKVLSQTNC